MIVLSFWVHRLWSTLHWTRWPWPRNAAAEPEFRASAEVALERVGRVAGQLGSAELLLLVGALVLGAVSLRWRPRWFAGAVLALCLGLTAMRFIVIE